MHGQLPQFLRRSTSAAESWLLAAVAASFRATSVVAVLLMIPMLNLIAQGRAVATRGAPARRWTVSISIGRSWANSHGDLERGLTTGGFNDPAPCFLFCTGNIAEPFSRVEGVTSTLALSYEVMPQFGVRLQEVTADLGETDGYHAASVSFLFLHQAVRSVAVFPVVSLGGIITIGAGPALHFVNVSRTNVPGGPPFKTTRFGAVVHGSLTIPARRRFFVEVATQYNYVPSVDVGPIGVKDVNGATTATMPLTHVKFTHPTLSAGLGLRF